MTKKCKERLEWMQGHGVNYNCTGECYPHIRVGLTYTFELHGIPESRLSGTLDAIEMIFSRSEAKQVVEAPTTCYTINNAGLLIVVVETVIYDFKGAEQFCASINEKWNKYKEKVQEYISTIPTPGWLTLMEEEE